MGTPAPAPQHGPTAASNSVAAPTQKHHMFSTALVAASPARARRAPQHASVAESIRIEEMQAQMQRMRQDLQALSAENRHLKHVLDSTPQVPALRRRNAELEAANRRLVQDLTNRDQQKRFIDIEFQRRPGKMHPKALLQEAMQLREQLERQRAVTTTLDR